MGLTRDSGLYEVLHENKTNKTNKNPKRSFIYLLTFKKESVAVLVVNLDSIRLGLLFLI